MKELLFILVFVSSAVMGFAQGIDTLLTTKQPKTTDYIISFEETFQSTRKIRNELLRDFQTELIETQYKAIKDQLVVYERIGDENLREVTLSKLNDLIIIFDRRLKSLEGWLEQLGTYTTSLSNFKIELEKRTEALDNADEYFRNDKNYYERRVRPLLSETDSVAMLVDARFDEILTLEYAMSQDYSKLQKRLDVLKAQRQVYWEQVLEPEDISWHVKLAKEDEKQVSAKHTFSQTVWRILDFFRVNFDRLVILLLLVALAAYLQFKLKDRDRAVDNTNKSGRFYGQPVALAFLIGGILFPAIFPPTTTLMYDFVLLLGYVPFLIILYHRMTLGDFWRYFIFFIFFLILKLNNLFLDISGYSAVILICCAIVFIYIVFPQSIRRYFAIRWRWVKIFNWLLFIATLAGIASILLKRVSLGRILINGAGESIAIALVLTFIANWFDMLFAYAKERPYFQRIATDKVRMEQFWNSWRDMIYAGLLLLFAIATLKNFSLYTNVRDGVISFFETERTLGDLDFTYGGLALFIIVIYISTRLSSLIKFISEDKSFYKDEKSTANLSIMIRFFLITGGFFLALVVSGIPVDKITIIIGALSVGIGFGLQNIVNNLISGLILVFERPIQTGDRVEVQAYKGIVKDIGIRSSIIKTYDGAEVIVPNGNLISQEVINWTLSNRLRRVEIFVGVAYGTDAEHATTVLNQVLDSHDKILAYPQPMVLLENFGNSSIDFRLLCWTTSIEDWIVTRSELMLTIYAALAKAKIEIPFPQRDLHIRSWKSDEIKIKTENNTAAGKQTTDDSASDMTDPAAESTPL